MDTTITGGVDMKQQGQGSYQEEKKILKRIMNLEEKGKNNGENGTEERENLKEGRTFRFAISQF